MEPGGPIEPIARLARSFVVSTQAGAGPGGNLVRVTMHAPPMGVVWPRFSPPMELPMTSFRPLALVALGLLTGCGATPPTAPNAPAGDPNSPPPTGTPITAQFGGVGRYRASGRVRVTIGDGRARIEMQSDFAVDAVPSPFLYLNTTNNANTGSPLRIGRLTANRGAQQYDVVVPAGVTYGWLLIWCDQFNTPVAEARLQ